MRAILAILALPLLLATARADTPAARPDAPPLAAPAHPSTPRDDAPGPAFGPDLPPRDVDHVSRAMFIAYSTHGHQGLGGHARSSNLPRSLDPATRPADEVVALRAFPDQPTAHGLEAGFRVVLVNASSAPLTVAASDSRLPIVQEARDAAGQWRPIEYLPRSWCGNSAHELTLRPGEQWDLVAPRYVGSVATELRLVLRTTTAAGPLELTSAPFAGSINPTQFTTHEGHVPTNVMDPYDE